MTLAWRMVDWNSGPSQVTDTTANGIEASSRKSLAGVTTGGAAAVSVAKTVGNLGEHDVNLSR